MENNFPTYDITSNQVSNLLEIHVRTAQYLLKETRKALGKPKNAFVSVQEFCSVNKLSEDEVLKALESIQPDPDSK